MAVVNLSLQVLPIVPEERVYPVVDKVIEFISQSGVKYIVSPSETTMEGELDTLLEIVKKAHYKPEGVTMDEKIYKYR